MNIYENQKQRYFLKNHVDKMATLILFLLNHKVQ